MADKATPHSEHPHEPPSQPASPDPKRTKYAEAAPNLSVASILNDAQATPTPHTAALPDLLPIMTARPDPAHTAAGAPALPTALAAAQMLPSMPPMATTPPPPALQIQLLSPAAKPPTRSSAFAAGYDLYASQAATIPAWGRKLVETDISIAVPLDTYGRVAPRSGLASKHGIDVGAGVIDSDYRGPLKVLLFNLTGDDFKVEAGDRIAQLIVERIYTPDVIVVDKLDETVRGAEGFGSTGGFGGSLPGINGVAGI